MRPTYSFDPSTRFVSKGVHNTFSIELQVKLWRLIDEKLKEKQDMDYLQIFELKVESQILTIKHSQEDPSFCEVHTFKTDGVIDGSTYKTYVIDDLTHSTMILASEY